MPTDTDRKWNYLLPGATIRFKMAAKLKIEKNSQIVLKANRK